MSIMTFLKECIIKHHFKCLNSLTVIFMYGSLESMLVTAGVSFEYRSYGCSFSFKLAEIYWRLISEQSPSSFPSSSSWLLLTFSLLSISFWCTLLIKLSDSSSATDSFLSSEFNDYMYMRYSLSMFWLIWLSRQRKLLTLLLWMSDCFESSKNIGDDEDWNSKLSSVPSTLSIAWLLYSLSLCPLWSKGLKCKAWLIYGAFLLLEFSLSK